MSFFLGLMLGFAGAVLLLHVPLSTAIKTVSADLKSAIAELKSLTQKAK